MSDSSESRDSRFSPEVQDWFLERWVDSANELGDGLDVVLLVDGFLVSGQLVGVKAYFDALSETFAATQSSPDAADRIRDYFTEVSTGLTPNAANLQDRPRYIHLKNARYFHPSGRPIPGNEPVLWRGRISEVSGFSFGYLGVPE